MPAHHRFPDDGSTKVRKSLTGIFMIIFLKYDVPDAHCPCQCAIPVFDGLLPEPYNRQILEVLFVAAHWHALAKLHMHNDLTLDVMDDVTASLGEKLRIFNDSTCSVFITRELEREFNARSRREAKKAAANRKLTARVPQHGDQTAQSRHPEARSVYTIATEAESGQATNGNARHLKKFNLNTYKCHALGDYT